MKFWWLKNTPRLGAERRSIEALNASEGWFDLERWGFREGNLCAEGVIVAHAKRYAVRLVYPDQFPEVPAWVEPQEDARWTTHQYGSGTLCLQLRPDNWVPSSSGADVLRSAYDLLVIEDPLGEEGQRAPSAHQVGELQAYDWGINPVLIGAGCHGRLFGNRCVGIKALRWKASDDVWPILLHDEQDRQGPLRPPGTDINSWRFEVPVIVTPAVPPVSNLDRAAFNEAGGFDPETAALLADSSSLVVFLGGSELTAFHLLAEGNPHRRRLFVLPDESGLRSGRAPEAAAKKVVIVGAGSLGSKVAESLVRSGVWRLVLVDGDVLLPVNLERHVLDWRDIGFRKVHGLKQRLLNVAPGADITVIDQNLSWQRSARTHAWQVASLAACDLIVDATGDAATSLFLGAIADANGRAFVSAEVFEGGIGALVATSIPDRDPPFAAGRAAFLAWCDTKGVIAPEPGSRAYEALAEDGTPLIADDAAVTTTAGHTTRVVLDILDGRPPPVNAGWLLIGYRNAWLFDGNGHTIRLNVGERSRAETPAEDPDAKAFVMALVKDLLGENKAGG